MNRDGQYHKINTSYHISMSSVEELFDHRSPGMDINIWEQKNKIELQKRNQELTGGSEEAQGPILIKLVNILALQRFPYNFDLRLYYDKGKCCP